MSKPSEPIYVPDYNSYYELMNRIKFVLILLEHEYQNARTHAQRNSYIHVARHEIEEIETMTVNMARQERNDVTDIPF